MKILFIGDVYGDPGIDYLTEKLPELKNEYKPNLIIVNAENASNGRGINRKIYKHFMSLGISLLTMGNHTWKNPEIKEIIADSNIIRPINDHEKLGSGYKIVKYNDKKILVINALGRIFIDETLESPFTIIDDLLISLKGQYDYSFLDFHAEVTSEKVAIAHHLDGKIDVVVGTHTHVQTNDNRILPQKTLYISDVGMTGALNGVIGVDKDVIIDRFINGYSKPNKIALGKRQLNGVIITIDSLRRTIEKIHLEE
ncbi:conserved hypothetical protein [Alteracholeplasma palmae J233]|uniref:Metallophosphoesterase n=1 Tax=Alteracholeplasma palmae (strain ATCC 49389 / J233) TaxID=1318466 RepID=U4KKU3_ALTPJ|nr:TIGR00282 family metallophosphoesterase [Alteracholeplasma palmae]CCV64293.1 conserved hypothetical protein [Alteracholeplasma palmae J233]